MLADDGSRPNDPVDILIGADLYWRFVSGEIKKCNNTGLLAIKSNFGWLLNGSIHFSENSSVNINLAQDVTVMKISSHVSETVQLSEDMHRFWDLDILGIKEQETNVGEKFGESIKFENGRYCVDLPLKENHNMLPDNFKLSVKRLIKLKDRLSKTGGLLEKYDQVFQEQLKAGILEKVDDPGEFGMCTYLPHKEVIRDDKESTKLRVVCDASAKSEINNPSLNDILYKGPCLNPFAI